MKRSFNMMASGATGVNVNHGGTVVQIIGTNKKTHQSTDIDTNIVVNNKRGGVTTVIRSPVDSSLIYLSGQADWLRYARWKRLRKFWHIVEALSPHITRDVALAVHALLFEPLHQDIVLQYYDNGKDNIGFILKRVTVPIHMGVTPLSVIEASIPVFTSHNFVAGSARYRDKKEKDHPFYFSLNRNCVGAGLRISYRQESPCIMQNCTAINNACMEWSLLDYLIVLAERERVGDIFSGPC